MEKKITIKNKWSEITINEYIQIIGILKDESLDELEINNYLLSILSGLDIKDIRKLNVYSFRVYHRDDPKCIVRWADQRDLDYAISIAPKTFKVKQG